MTAEVAPLLQPLNAARTAAIAAAFADPPDRAGMLAKVDAIAAAEMSVAAARAAAFGKLQASPARLSANQVTALIASGGRGGGGRGAGGAPTGHGTIPQIREPQVAALTKMSTDVMPLTRTLTAARAAVTAAALTEPRNDAAIRSAVDAVKRAELACANARADAFAKIQASPNKLASDQVAAFLALGGTFANVAFTQPEPLTFSRSPGLRLDVRRREFEGMGWKSEILARGRWGDRRRIHAAESERQQLPGVPRLEAKDFTLKFEIKVEGTGGSGFQYRSKTGIPWLANIADNVTANVGPVNLELDDDRTAGRLLAEFTRLDRPVLFREHADAHHGVARPGGGGRGDGRRSS